MYRVVWSIYARKRTSPHIHPIVPHQHVLRLCFYAETERVDIAQFLIHAILSKQHHARDCIRIILMTSSSSFPHPPFLILLIIHSRDMILRATT